MDYLDFGYDGYLSKTGVIGYAYEPATQFDSKSDTSFITTTMITGGAAGGDWLKYRRKSTSALSYFSSAITNNAGLRGNMAPSTNTIMSWPFIVGSQSITIDTLAIHVTIAAASTAVRIGIYTSDTISYPANLIVDSGEIATTSTGLKTVSTSKILEANGLYWLVINSNSGATALAADDATSQPIILGETVLNGYSQSGWNAATAFGAFPSTYPAGASSHFTTCPVFVRIAA